MGDSPDPFGISGGPGGCVRTGRLDDACLQTPPLGRRESDLGAYNQYITRLARRLDSISHPGPQDGLSILVPWRRPALEVERRYCLCQPSKAVLYHKHCKGSTYNRPRPSRNSRVHRSTSAPEPVSFPTPWLPGTLSLVDLQLASVRTLTSTFDLTSSLTAVLCSPMIR